MVLHPALVHFPIAFLIGSSALDITSYLTTTLPRLTLPLLQLFPALPKSVPALTSNLQSLSYIAGIAGLVFAVPASMSGAWAAYTSVFKYRGFTLKDEVVRTTLLHSIVSYTAILTAAYNVFVRDGEGVTGWNALVSGVVLVATWLAGSLGGKLTYEYGVQVRRKVVKGKTT